MERDEPDEAQSLFADLRSLLKETHRAAGMAYGLSKGGSLQRGWSREPITESSSGELSQAFRDADAEFLRSPNGQLIVAFRGTSQAADWKANIGNVLGVHNKKYDAAAKIGAAFKDRDDVAFTGHSLGGGLAKLAGEVASTGQDVNPKTVVGFNAAPVSPATYRMHGVAEKNHVRKTVHVVNENDILNRVVKGGKLAFASAKGLFERERSDNSVIVVASGKGSVLGASGHSIKQFVSPSHTANANAFTAILENAAGEHVSLASFDRFKPRMPEQGRSGVILGGARASFDQSNSRSERTSSMGI